MGFSSLRRTKWKLLLLFSTYILLTCIFMATRRPNKRGGNLLAKTVVFPRGGDNLAFDQPWEVDEVHVHESIQHILGSGPRTRVITADFTWSPGIGNLMFQFAALHAFCAEFGAILVLPSDCMLRRAFRFANATAVRFVRSDALKAHIEANQHEAIEFKNCCRFDLRPKALVFPPNGPRAAVLKGYFQSFRYFHPALERKIREAFQFLQGVQQMAERKIAEIKLKHGLAGKKVVLVGVHVRRGMDVALHQRNQRHGHVAAPLEFYARAMDHFRRAHPRELLVFVVVGDSPAWARLNIVAGGTSDSIVHHATSQFREVDLALLSKCDHTVISTGTFGWFGGYLANGKVAYFDGWPRPGSDLDRMLDKKDYFLPQWTPIG